MSNSMHSGNDKYVRLPGLCILSQINGRERNEDSFHVFPLCSRYPRQSLTVLALADGMGGLGHGADISCAALRKLSLALFEQLHVENSLNSDQVPSWEDEYLEHALWNAVEQVNSHVLRMVQTNRWQRAGSTLVVALVLDNHALVANLGDSPLFHFSRAQDRLAQITHDHTVAAILLRDGMITPEMARFHEGRSRLEFYLGRDHLPPERSLCRVDLARGDLVLLCSDGVNGALTLGQMESCLKNGALDRQAENLLKAGRDAGETDNQTLILWRHGVPARDTQVVTLQEREKMCETLPKEVAAAPSGSRELSPT